MQNFMKTILSALQAWTKKEFIKKNGEIKEDINNIQKEMVATNKVLDNKMNAVNPVATGSFSMGRQDGSDIGRGSYAVGLDTIASGRFSHAEGFYTTASGNYSHAEGSHTLAATESSHAEGYSTTADGSYSHAEGYDTIAANITSHAEGIDTAAMGAYSHAEGKGTAAAGECSHAEGKQTYINLYLTGQGGSKTYTVAGSPSLVVGALLVSEKYPSAMAYITAISGKTITTNKTLSASAFSNQHVKMFPNFASGIASHIEGQDTTASGNYSHAEGKSTTASGESSHAEGYQTTASGTQSHAEGYGTVASGGSSHAEGRNTTASGDYSHAEGRDTTASGIYSHTEGNGTTASRFFSHAEGSFTIASADSTHAEGSNTIAASTFQHAQGKYNIEDSTSTYAHIVGNGTSDTERSNAHTLDWNGVGWFQGGLQVGGTEQDGEGVGYVPFIPSAQVGQTIVVSEVDENGKPTKWEAADMGSDIEVDTTLTVDGQAADAKAVGDALAGKQPAGNYLTEVPAGYAKSEDIPTKPSDIGAQPAGNYATKGEIPTTLPNPHKLTFSGAVNAEYDGSEAVEVVIPQGGGGESGGAAEMTLLGEVDCSQVTGNIELTGLNNITEIYAEWAQVENGTETQTGYFLYINGKGCCMQFIPAYKTGEGKFGWSHAIYNGRAWMCERSNGAISSDYQRFGDKLNIEYNHIVGEGPAKTIELGAPNNPYTVTKGTIKIWGR